MDRSHRKVPAGSFVSHCDTPSGAHCQRVSSAVPEAFGPIAWNFIHTAAEHYNPQTDTDRDRCSAWVKNTPVMLPCRNCEKHMEKHVQEHDPRAACQSSETLRDYFVDLHNKVNDRTGGEAPWTSQQAQEQYATVELCID